MSNRTDIVVETDNAEGQVLLSASRVYDLTEDKTQDTINGEIRNTLNQLDADKAEKTDLASPTNKTTPNNDGNQIEKGTYFYLDGALARAKEVIGANAPFTLGTNYELVTAGGLNKLSVKTLAFSATSTASGSLVTNLSPANTAIICASEIHNYRVMPWLYTSTKWALSFFDVSLSNIQVKSETAVSGVIMYLEF